MYIQIPHKLLEIRDPSRHFISQLFNWHNFNPDINDILVVKDSHFGAHVVDHERIFAKLNFYSYSVFNKVDFPKRTASRFRCFISWSIKLSWIFAHGTLCFCQPGLLNSRLNALFIDLGL